jgi:hypothetical protein
MSRRRDPIVIVLSYFSDADLILAEQALALVKEIVAQRRRPKPVPVKKPRPVAEPAAV